MNLIGNIIVSPLWGIISTQLFLQSWLALINFVINLVGIAKGRVERKVNLMGMGIAYIKNIRWLNSHATQYIIHFLL